MATKQKTQEFLDHFERLSQTYGDPVEVLFQIAFGSNIMVSDRRAAASDLLSYRYPKQKAIDLSVGAGAQGLSFLMIGPQGGQEKQVQAIDAQKEFGLFETVKPALTLVKD